MPTAATCGCVMVDAKQLRQWFLPQLQKCYRNIVRCVVHVAVETMDRLTKRCSQDMRQLFGEPMRLEEYVSLLAFAISCTESGELSYLPMG